MTRGIDRILGFLKNNGISSIEEAKEICESYGPSICSKTVKGIQMISFDDAALGLYRRRRGRPQKRRGLRPGVAGFLGRGAPVLCLEGSVAEERKLGIGQGKLASMVLSEDVRCFPFWPDTSPCAAEGAIGIARSANRVRKVPLRVILNVSWERRGRNHFARQRLLPM
jgi:hypothetical protein